MNDDLFFIPILEHALEQTDVTTALTQAFARIHTLGQQPRYSQGHRQFLQFMKESRQAHPQEAAEQILGHFCQDFARTDELAIVLERSRTRVDEHTFHGTPVKWVVDNIRPGPYRLTLDTGRVLWQDVLTEEDLVWAKAFPQAPLKMAAASEEGASSPTRRLELLGGSMVLQVFAGIEHGSIEIEMR